LSRGRSESINTSGGPLANGLDQVRHVLGSRDFRVLLAARLASQVAEGAFLAAVLDTVVFLPESQSTLRGFALATALTLLPFSLVEPFAGVFVDRWARRPILVVLPLVRAAFALLLLPLVGVAALTYAGTLVVFSANRLFQATATAVVPRVVGAGEEAAPADARLFAANMVASVAGTVALFGGIFAGGLVTSASGTAVTITLACIAWLAASAISARLSDTLPPREIHDEGVGRQLSAAAADLVDGFRRIGRTPAALAPVLSVAVGQFLQVIVIATTLAVITGVLGGGLLTFSGLVGAGGVGVFLGFLTSGLMRSRMPGPLLMAAAFVLAALALLPVLVTAVPATLVAGAVLLGASYGWTRVPADTLAQRAVPDGYRGRVFTAVDLGFNTARVLGALAAVVVVPLLGPRITVITLLVLFLAWAPVVPLWLRRVTRAGGAGDPSGG
jgi:MFS family permease